jgi:iron uptake system component EfeO
MPSKSRVFPVAAVLAAIAVSALAAGCGGGKNDGAATGAKTQTLAVTLTDDGCSPARLHAKAGAVTVEVSNGGTSKVSELELKNADGIIVGERENIVEGIDGSFTLDLRPGRYTLSCPNAEREDNGVLVVTGAAAPAQANAAAALLEEATTGYHAYVVAQTAQLLAGTRRLVAALDAGSLEEAKSMFGPVRLHYEAIEPVAESFGDLDPEIDARVNDVDDPATWTGFHRIEQILWIRGTTDGGAKLGAELLADVETLQRRVRTLTFQPAQLANGAVELLNEVAGSKITGEEDRYSHTDLSDFQGNLNGARVAFELLRPALVKRGEAPLARTIATRFATVQKGLDRYKRSTPLGFATYDELTASDRRAFAQQIDALAEPLSTVAAKVTG